VQSPAANLEILQRTDLFGALAPTERATLAACFVVRCYRKDEIVFREGDAGATLLVVAEGELVATARTPDGGAAKLNSISAGETMGEMSFLDPAPRSATVTATTDAVAYELSHDTMEVLRRRAPAAAAAIVTAVIHDVTRRLRVLDERIESELERKPTAPRERAKS
jgi:CRP-like cAMP-binding protein